MDHPHHWDIWKPADVVAHLADDHEFADRELPDERNAESCHAWEHDHPRGR